uniref:Uncharacterized protein n=1 Tax=Oryza nivara TaxID=4536 RepID=A0A0E0HPF9_ORYNI
MVVSEAGRRPPLLAMLFGSMICWIAIPVLFLFWSLNIEVKTKRWAAIFLSNRRCIGAATKDQVMVRLFLLQDYAASLELFLLQDQASFRMFLLHQVMTPFRLFFQDKASLTLFLLEEDPLLLMVAGHVPAQRLAPSASSSPSSSSMLHVRRGQSRGSSPRLLPPCLWPAGLLLQLVRASVELAVAVDPGRTDA